MALTQAASVQTLHSMMLRNVSMGENYISLFLGGHLKQCHPKFKVRMVKFHAYAPDARLCVVLTLNEYIMRTEILRKDFGNDNKKLLISLIKSHWHVSRDKVAR